MLLNNRYRVLQVLGEGGFGQTFLAEDTHMPSQRRCVIKQLKPAVVGSDPLIQGLFLREAAILEELGERNEQIPQLFAYFTEEDKFFLVQEWIDGETLTQKLRRAGVLSGGQVCQLLISLLPVLDYVHRNQIIHRDIKPDNIMVRHRDGKPILIDFGVVKQVMSTMIDSQGQMAQSIVVGSPGFMAPEQAAGRPVYASDLFSLGLTAIYLLTGKQPRQLVDPRTGVVGWQDHVADLPAGVARILDRAIEPNLLARYPSAAAMLSDLQVALSDAATIAPSPANQPTPPPVTLGPERILPVLQAPLSLATPAFQGILETVQGVVHSFQGDSAPTVIPSLQAETADLGWSFWRGWILANLVGYPLGLVSLGFGSGLMQRLALNRHGFAMPWLWVWATMAGYLLTIVWALWLLLATFGLRAAGWTRTMELAALLLVWGNVTLVGLAQRFILKDRIRGAGWWVLANAFALFPALIIHHSAQRLLNSVFTANAAIVVSAGVFGAAYGAITGVVLIWLVRQSRG